MKLYNSLTKQIEDFKPLNFPLVTLYTCGPTVYNYAHIGNLRTYIFEDLLHRSLEYFGYKVNHVMNITDVGHLTGDRDAGEDKVEKEAKKEDKPAWDIAKFYTGAFLKDIDRLNILKPTTLVAATDHIAEMISLIQTLAQKGFTYKTSDGVYFDTSKLSDYGKLATVDLNQLKQGARVEFSKEKRNPTDFALWKFSPKDSHRQMEWNSPWGLGFPGWHIECSAMSLKYLGNCYPNDKFTPENCQTIDIHTGAVDHINVHHTNEIAQSEAATGVKFVKYWLHGEFLLIEKGRMGKSEGNFITLNDLVKKGYNPLSYRYFCLTTHYRQKLNFTFEGLDAAQNALTNLYSYVCGLIDTQKGQPPLTITKEQKLLDYQSEFKKVISDDLNICQALAIAWQMLKSNIPSEDKIDLIYDFDKILGLDIKKNTIKIEIPADVKTLVGKRTKARIEKRFADADKIRQQILDLGFVIEDTEKGETIKPIF